MNAGTPGPALSEIPTFSECVIGYRRWWMDDRGELWPLWQAQRPWVPGRNTARCECASWTSLRFESRVVHGRRVLEPLPEHAAPADKCTCGLYSWRRPRKLWYEEPWRSTPPSVIGAVASWGRMQVHADGFRAEFASIVTLAFHPDISTPGLNVLGHIAHNYRAELVELDRLEEAASRHGSPLPDSLGPHPKLPPLDEPRPRPVRPHPSLTAEPPPEKQPRIRTYVLLLVLGAICCAAGIVFFDPSSVGWRLGQAHAQASPPHGSGARPWLFGVVMTIVGAALIIGGAWGLWAAYEFSDGRLIRLLRVRRPKAAADRSAR